MIELNLLPKELRKKEKREIPKVNVMPIAIGVMATLVMIHIILIVLVSINDSKINKLKPKWDQIQPLKTKTELLATQTVDLEKRLTAMKGIAEPPIDWPRILSGLNKSMVPTIWLYDFNPVSRQGQLGLLSAGMPQNLSISGYDLGESEEATSSVGKFINNLKKDPDFSEFFTGIELEGINSRIVSGQKVMMFKLNCTFKDYSPKDAANKDVKVKASKRKKKSKDDRY